MDGHATSFIQKCLQKIVNIIWREINTNYNLWNTNWRAGDDESENERAKHCTLSFYILQQCRYNGLACPADYSIFTWQLTCPPMEKSMLTQEWTRRPVVSVLAYSDSGWTTDEPVLSPDRHYDAQRNGLGKRHNDPAVTEAYTGAQKECRTDLV